MARKIYFCGSIRGGRDDAHLYAELINELKQYGTVFTECVGKPYLEEVDHDLDDSYMKQIYEQDMQWLKECDAVVAEVTQPSLGVGMEIGTAIALNKKILCLFRPDSGRLLSCMISGASNGTTFKVRNYNEKDITELFKQYFCESGLFRPS